MIIGVPKEIMPGERRVAASPETVEKMVKDGLTVLVEKDAGEGAFYHDPDYVAAGASIVDDVCDIFKRADVILKVKEPLFNEKKDKHEVDMMHEGQTLITFIHPAAPVNHEMVKRLAAQGVTSITLDGIPRITRAQVMDALTSMSTCAGYKGMLIAANELPHFAPQIFTAVGMIKPINVLVIGAGVGGLQAIATAKRLGAIVHAADIRPAAAEQAMSLGAKVIELGIPSEEAIGEGGYALALTEKRLEEERQLLAEHVKNMDIIFLSALVPGKLAPTLITEEMVKSMKPGSAIVDISIDQGGNCEITPPGTIEVKHHVTLVGIKNIPGLLPTSSTWMFAQNVYNLLKYLIKDDKIYLDMDDEIIQSALTTHNGKVVHQGALEAFAALGH
ncbi:MAG: NAD(P) transhydrogenase subunit alpha [Clostridiales bacterium]|jgi:NAD(P) transhydrogenase subunit alpha|nr:NAD(P) transhydrogenase subunit alpha [Clostridiales bacterium]MDD2572050.1 NAD(P) transhydrogenase subunit alpha [Eubacteriales bacterium]MDD4606679.1 NAD(P) transhydrogenase subunit alpha [Dysgonamonadaceae bacterium]NLG30697.1 NAD(P) transhydrogenase subunit alpha [Clostridiaceae bacterium]MCK9350714.1 NAD(P) transhydrogenase subunit alpha [Clostridiales bacterium]